jgi:hypothetical protein
MPILTDIRDHKVLGREYKRGRVEGARTVLRLLIQHRFGPIPAWVEERLTTRSVAELEDLCLDILDAPTLEDLLKPPMVS